MGKRLSHPSPKNIRDNPKEVRDGSENIRENSKENRESSKDIHGSPEEERVEAQPPPSRFQRCSNRHHQTNHHFCHSLHYYIYKGSHFIVHCSPLYCTC
mgnify:CR=1 FL=1